MNITKEQSAKLSGNELPKSPKVTIDPEDGLAFEFRPKWMQDEWLADLQTIRGSNWY